MTGSRRLLVTAALVVAWVLVAVVPPAERGLSEEE
jgi:hypothetical protein